jgi:hypothetical protein
LKAEGSNKGLSVTTDGNGYFSIPGVWGDFDVSVSRIGYDAQTAHVSVNESVSRADMRLMPDSQPSDSVFTGTLCTVADPLVPGGGVSGSRCIKKPFPYPTQIHHRLPVHRPGTMTVAADYVYQGDYYSNYLSFELRCGSQVISRGDIHKTSPFSPSVLWSGTRTVQVDLPQACE